jgi:phospholipase/lecithinase/hemolysin
MRGTLVVITAALLTLPLGVASASPLFSQVYVFGDSLSDNGNAAIVLGGSLPGNYAPNAFTDGPATSPATSGPFGLWIDQFAADLGLPDPQPYLANPVSNTNYAVASAQTGSSNLQDISNQVSAFSIQNAGVAPSNGLYAIWGGANDLYNGTNSGTAAADNLYANILTLSAEGANSFLWFNLPTLSETPRGAGSATLGTESSLFNAEWAADLAKLQAAGIDVTGVDVNAEFNSILADPALYGFTNVTSPAQGISGNPNNYLFWDTEHPTTAADALLAQLAAGDLTATPEPGSFALLLLGAVGLCMLGQRGSFPRN